MSPVRALLIGILLGSTALVGQSSNPVPYVNQPLSPDAAPPGGSSLTLAVSGTGFVSGSVVQWNGHALATTFVSSSQLKANVPAANIATTGSAIITVASPAPGGGVSNAVTFEITEPVATPAFFARLTYPSSELPPALTAADFNGDGIPDLAVIETELNILLGKGDGTFQQGQQYKLGYGPNSVVAADFNGDGKIDLAVSNENCKYVPCPAGKISVLLGNGDGSFQIGGTYDTGPEPFQVLAADMNGDGKLDLITADNCGYNCGGEAVVALSVLPGNGDGTFQNHIDTEFDNSQYAWAITLGDFNNDGKLDVAAVDYCPSNCKFLQQYVTVVLGDGDGTFRPDQEIVVNGYGSTGLTTADVNGDGKLDLLVGESYTSAYGLLGVMLGNGDGSFQSERDYKVQDPWSIVVADFNGDNKLDVATSNYNDLGLESGTISVVLGDGAGHFGPYTNYPTGTAPQSLITGDFNRDGSLDLADTDFNDGTFSAIMQSPVAFSTPKVSFPGDTVLNTSSVPQQVTLANSGAQVVHISQIGITGTNNKDFTAKNTCNGELQPHTTCQIAVTFTPQQIGTRVAGLTVYDDAAGAQQTTDLTAIGTAISLVPSKLAFGNEQVGQTSAPQNVTLLNVGKGTVSSVSVMIAGADPQDFTQTNNCPKKINGGAGCTIAVTFTPTANGTRTATLTVSEDHGGGSPQFVTLSGTGTSAH